MIHAASSRHRAHWRLLLHLHSRKNLLVVVSETACKSNKMLSKCVTWACRWLQRGLCSHHVSLIKTFQSRRVADGCCEWSRCNNIHVIQNVIEERHVILTFLESCGEASRWISVFQLKLFNPFLHFYFFEAFVWLYCYMQYVLSKTVVWQGKHLLKQYCLYILGFSYFHPWGLFFLVTLVLKHRRLPVGLLAFRTETVVQTQPLGNYYPNRICSRSQLTIDCQVSAQ